MTSRREQIRARLEKVNEKLTRRESLDGPDWQAYAENAPFDLAYLLAELDAGEALRWQPIDSAPKDGTNILLTDGTTVSQGGWLDAAAQGVDPEAAHTILEDWWSVDLISPTHWMPLPASPVESVPGAEKT
jgi:hypothetical protein